jgi:hypothetical protein
LLGRSAAEGVIVNPGPFIPIALVLGCVVAIAVTWPFGRSAKGSFGAALLTTPVLSFVAVLVLLLWFEGDLEGFLAAMGGQGLRLAGWTALLAIPCSGLVGLMVLGGRHLLRGSAELPGDKS